MSKLSSLLIFATLLIGLIAITGVMPAAHAANADLFVSAESSQFDNYMSGPQVIEVVVIDSDIDDTDEARGEPDVTVNGKTLRMVQGVDGNWYGYFADRTMAETADSTQSISGVGIDFGYFCDNSLILDGPGPSSVDFTDTAGVAIPSSSTGQDNSIAGASCGTITSTINAPNNVVRESRDPNLGDTTSIGVGQIDIVSDAWPFIQLYNLNPSGPVIVQYFKGGGVQTSTLTFDTVEQFANLTLDKSVFSRNSQVHVTVTDLWLNIDPTDEDSWTFGTNSTNGLTTNYQVFDEHGAEAGASVPNGIIDISNNFYDLMIEDNGILILNVDAQSVGTNVVTIQDTLDTVITCSIPQDISTCATSETAAGLGKNSQPITITEQWSNSGVFTTYDESDESVLLITNNAIRGTSATIDYNETPMTILAVFDFGTIDIQSIGGEWTSGEEIPVVLVDADANKNSKADEDLDFYNPSVDLIPSLQTGNPFTLESLSSAQLSNTALTIQDVQAFSQRAMLDSSSNSIAIVDGDSLVLVTGDTFADLYESINNPSNNFKGFNFYHYNLRSLQNSATVGTIVSFDIDITDGTKTTRLASNVNSFADNLIDLSSATGDDIFSMDTTLPVQIIFTFETIIGNPVTDGGIVLSTEVPPTILANTVLPIASDFFSFGIINDGLESDERVANQILRLELEETGDNTSNFVGSLEYTMVNQVNLLDVTTYTNLDFIADDPSFIVIDDLTDEDAPRVTYNDLGKDGVTTQIADQEEAPSHSGVISFDLDNYKAGDDVNITLVDMDLNTDSDIIDIFTVVDPRFFPTDPARDTVGKAGLGLYSTVLGEFGRLVDVTFNDHRWTSGLTENGGFCGSLGDPDDGLSTTGFTLIETGASSGVFLGDFDIPFSYCNSDTGLIEMTIGTDIEINYVDFRDASGGVIEVGDSAGIRANTGSVSLDRTVYPVPWGQITDFDDPIGDQVTPAGSNLDETRSLEPIHATGITDGDLDEEHETLGNGNLIIHVRVNDPDFDLLEFGEDAIEQDVSGLTVGPVKISITRDTEEIILGYAGGSTPNTNGVIDVNADAVGSELDNILQLGAIYEIAPDAGIFEIDFPIRYTDGPDSTICPDTDNYVGTDGTTQNTDPLIRFDTLPVSDENFCILQGDIITVEYTDPADASGSQNIVTDSATFDLRNGVLQSNKSVYIIGSDMILTLIEPDFDLDNDQAEIYDLDLIEWDSDAATLTMGDIGGETIAFDPEPFDLRETGDSTGIFQIVIAIPQLLDNDYLERGEEIILEYHDWGPSSADYVGQEKRDVNVTIFTSNFGATVELDQKVYSWTDIVYITIVAADHNVSGDVIDSIGENSFDPLKISTRYNDLDNYMLVETGTDTGIFTGEVRLSGFCHNADGDVSTGDDGTNGCSTGDDIIPITVGTGPTDGLIGTSSDDGLTVSFEFREDETVVGSALIRWNMGDMEWSKPNYVSSVEGELRLVEPDLNLDPTSIDIFTVNVWSDTDPIGIQLSMIETGITTGIFENNVAFTSGISSGNTLAVHEGDTITAQYVDYTLPDPYTISDSLEILATTTILPDDAFVNPSDTIVEFTSYFDTFMIDSTNLSLNDILVPSDSNAQKLSFISGSFDTTAMPTATVGSDISIDAPNWDVSVTALISDGTNISGDNWDGELTLPTKEPLDTINSS